MERNQDRCRRAMHPSKLMRPAESARFPKVTIHNRAAHQRRSLSMQAAFDTAPASDIASRQPAC